MEKLSNDFHFVSRLRRFNRLLEQTRLLFSCNLMHRSMTPYQDHTERAQKVSSESRLYGRVFRDNPYHHPSLLPSSRPRCFLLFSSHSSKPTRAIVGALRCCRSRKKNENQYSDSNALERERHAGCQHRRVVDTFCSKRGAPRVGSVN